MDPLTLTSADILGATRPELVFGFGDKETCESVFKSLRRKWHPDRNDDPKATEVFCRLQELFDHIGNYLVYVASGSQHNFKQRCVTRFLLGDIYHHEGGIAIVLDEDKVKFSKVLQDNLKRIHTCYSSANPDLKKMIDDLVPVLHRVSDDGRTIVLKFPAQCKGAVNLSLLINSQGGKLEPRVVAWVISRMFNYAMIMQKAGLINNAFSPEHFWINLKDHSGFDPLSLFFATGFNEKLRVLTGEGQLCLPAESLAKKVSHPVIDIRLIKKAGIRALGDTSGSGMSLDKDIPEALRTWLRSTTPTESKVLDVYKDWQERVLNDAFGKRSFYKWEVDPLSVMQPK